MATIIRASIEVDTSRVSARTERGAAFSMNVDAGAAAGPKEALLASLAGCTGMDVVSILRKKRQRVVAYDIEVIGHSAEEHPRVFIAIGVEHRVHGEVTSEALRRSIELSATTYCPVNAMLSARATIEHRYRLTDAHGGSHEAVVAITGPDGIRVL
ncbi:MAG: OsmC family protein [Candidatus Limnocylindria bacterium]